MSGIGTIRSSVTSWGRLRGMQVAVDLFRERTADAVHFGNFIDGSRLHALQAAEMREQLLPAPRSDAGNLGEHRGGARLAALGTMADDGEAVRLVADALDQVQAGVLRRQ